MSLFDAILGCLIDVTVCNIGVFIFFFCNLQNRVAAICCFAVWYDIENANATYAIQPITIDDIGHNDDTIGM